MSYNEILYLPVCRACRYRAWVTSAHPIMFPCRVLRSILLVCDSILGKTKTAQKQCYRKPLGSINSRNS